MRDTIFVPSKRDPAGVGNDVAEVRVRFAKDGVVAVRDIIDKAEIHTYRAIYDRFLSGDIDSGPRRSDLGAGAGSPARGIERITQIMWPSLSYPALGEMSFHVRSLSLARSLLGADLEPDFDMLIDKAPGSSTPTPWHQDAAYWVDLPDKRAVSVWLALDDADLDNGCMWYGIGSHTGPLRRHWPAGTGGGALECDADESTPGATALPLSAGSCAAHDGMTLHYSRGNSTAANRRRALIANFRPGEMIEMERRMGMDHGMTDNVRTVRTAPMS
jgi:phytanoyl-CoA hydroxylase